jgi:hypothetical protein
MKGNTFMELKDKQELISILSSFEERINKLENPQPSEKDEEPKETSEEGKQQDTEIDDIEKFLED